MNRLPGDEEFQRGDVVRLPDETQLTAEQTIEKIYGNNKGSIVYTEIYRDENIVIYRYKGEML
jgi:hypothetical protein